MLNYIYITKINHHNKLHVPASEYLKTKIIKKNLLLCGECKNHFKVVCASHPQQNARCARLPPLKCVAREIAHAARKTTFPVCVCVYDCKGKVFRTHINRMGCDGYLYNVYSFCFGCLRDSGCVFGQGRLQFLDDHPRRDHFTISPHRVCIYFKCC